MCSQVCGEGIVISGQEQCDNGNWWAYDGYIWSCTVECGWERSGGMCTGICGDGMRKGAERYDDGNTHLDTCGGELECGGPVDSCEGGCGLGQRTTCSSNE